MRHIDLDFNGRTYALSFTAEALFQCFDRFGPDADLLKASHCLEPTAEGWRNCCWLAALMAAQGELQRRALGYDPQPMVTMEELRTGFMAAESSDLRMAVRQALEQGFRRELPDAEPEGEINLVLQAREETEKKTDWRGSVQDIFRSLLSAFTWPPETP